MKKYLLPLILIPLVSWAAATVYKQPNDAIFYKTLKLPQLGTSGIVTNTSAGLLGTQTYSSALGSISPLNTKGDFLSYSSSNVRVPVGATTGYVPVVDPGATVGWSWQAQSGGGFNSPLTTKGDIIGYSTTSVRIPVGSTTGTFAVVDPGSTVGWSWASIISSQVPTLNQNTTGTSANVTGTVALANGGTGISAGSSIAAYNALSPLSTKGDIHSFNGTQNVRMPIGSTTGTFAVVDPGSTVGWSWASIVSSQVPTLNQNTTGTSANVTGIVALANGGIGINAGSSIAAFNAISPLSTKGDIHGFNGTQNVRVPIGATTGYVSVVDPGATVGWSWQLNTPLSTKGDFLGFSSSKVRVPIGATTGYVPVVDPGATVGWSWQGTTLGAVVQDWKSDLTFTASNLGTLTNSNFQYKRIGDMMFVRGFFTTGTTAGSAASINLPAGITIDTTKLPAFSTILGVENLLSATPGVIWAAQSYANSVIYDGSTNSAVFFSQNSASATAYSKLNGTQMVASNGDSFTFEFSFPVLGWGTTGPIIVQSPMTTKGDLIGYSSSAVRIPVGATIGTSLVTDPGSTIGMSWFDPPSAHYTGTSTILTSGASVLVNFSTKDFDNFNAMNAGGWYVVPVSGKYMVNAGASVGGTWAVNKSQVMSIVKNGSTISRNLQYAQGAVLGQKVTISDIISVAAGDTISIFNTSNSTVPVFNGNTLLEDYFSIVRVGN
jgi:hypothetical protein